MHNFKDLRVKILLKPKIIKLVILALILTGGVVFMQNAKAADTLMFSADGDGYNKSAELFVDRPSDFKLVKQVFNTVLISPGDQNWVTDCQNIGLKCILEFDYKWDFIAGVDITLKVQNVINQVKANPGTISGIFVADRLNSWANDPDGTGPRDAIPPDKMIEYLKQTGGAIHQQLPGIPVIVDVSDLELVCGQPGQLSCSYIQPGSTSMYRYETNDMLVQLKNTGYVDIFYIADSIARDCTDPNSSKCWDANVQSNAWQKARSLLPEPFKIMPRTSGLSFPEITYPYSSMVADKAVKAAMTVPLQQGANGVQLWGWHINWDDGLRTWLNKDMSSNVLWEKMKEVSAQYLGTPQPLDTSPPEISGVQVNNINASSADITWTTNEPSDSQVEYGVTAAYGNITLLNSNLANSHSIALGNLAANTTYHFRVKSRDASGNSSISSDITFTTLAFLDTQAPSAPTGLSATAIASYQINLSWIASLDNVGVIGYRVYRGGTQIAIVSGTTYSDTNLISSTTYIYTVSAYDAAGNTSLQSASASATTFSSQNKFNTGDRVIVNAKKLRVRSAPTGKSIGFQVLNAQGIVIGGPVVKNGYTWWNINYDNPPDGWSAENWLSKTLTAALPEPSLTAVTDTRDIKDLSLDERNLLLANLQAQLQKLLVQVQNLIKK